MKPGGEDSLARDQLRAEAVRLVSDQPLTGLGFGGFGISSERGYNDAHSLSFTVLAEQGLLGLGVLFAVIAVVFLLSLPFLAAGTLAWPQGLIYLGLLIFLTGGSRVLLARKYPDLVQERLHAAERSDSKQGDKKF